MPELPEVETVRRQLSEEVVGEVVAGLEVREKKCYEGTQKIEGERIARVMRVGKYLFIYFESGRGLAVHLKMTGRLVVGSEWYEKAAHTRVVIRLLSGRSIYYWDTRMFGYVKVEEEIEKYRQTVKKRLGLEPWEMTVDIWLGKLQKTGRKVKDVLLDQTMIAGVGNIYANDALHLAGVMPTRRANELGQKQGERLLVAVRQVMERGLATNGASDNSYVDARGEKGAYQNEFRVYGKTKKECPSCANQLTYIKVSGRGTWYCSSCQR